MIFSSRDLLFMIQGALEFLPVSSTAHMVLFSKWVHLPFLDVAQTAALHLIPGLFLCFVFRRDIVSLLKGFWLCLLKALSGFLTYEALGSRQICVENRLPGEEAEANWKQDREEVENDPEATLFRAVFWGTLPTLLVGFILALFHIEIPRSVTIIGSNSIIFGLLMGIVDAKTPVVSGKIWTRRQGFILGLMQILAFVPGVSRLGICLTTARAMGFSRESSLRFSFLCGIPVLLSAGFFGLCKNPSVLSSFCSASMLVLCAGTLLLGGVILHLFVEALRSHTLKTLAFYRVGLGLLILLCI